MGTLAKVLEKFGIHHQRSVLSRRQTHSPCPESRNFSKPAIIMPSWRKPADPTLAGWQPSPDPSQASRRVPRRPAASGVPCRQGMFLMQLCHCKSPDSAGKPWVWTCSCPRFLPNGHFPLLSLFFQVQSFPRLHSSILRIPKQLETLPKARRGKPRTLPTAACLAWTVQPKEQI